MSSQGSAADDFMSSSQNPVFSQESALDDHVISSLTQETSDHKRKRPSSPEVFVSSSQVTATPPRKRQTPQSTLTKLATSVPHTRYLQLQARGMDEVFKMNEANLGKTSDLFKYKLYRSTQPSIFPTAKTKDNNSKAENPPSRQLSNILMPSTPISPTSPIVRVDTTPAALFLYCLWVIAPTDGLSLYLDSTIPRPSCAFTTYLYSAFLLALELKDATFLHDLINVILKDHEAGWPDAPEIARVYESTEPGCLLRDFVVDCTLTCADETAAENWRAWMSRTPKDFVVDLNCRMLELSKNKWGWVKSEVATKYMCGHWWPMDYLEKTPELGGEWAVME